MAGRLLIVAAFGVMSALSACAEPNLTVMTFNLRYGSAKDGDNSWANRKDILINTIKEQSPDVIGTQECLEEQSDYIAASLPEYRWIGIGREKNSSGEMAAIFYKKSVLAPIETGNFWLSDKPDVPGYYCWDSSCPRITTWAKFRHIPSDTYFFHFNTHTDHKGEIARQKGVELITNRAKGLAGDLPIILTGDFNCHGGEAEAWKIALNAGYKDSWNIAKKQIGPDMSFGNFAAPIEGRHERIDWIMLHGGIECDKCECVLRNEGGRYPSDHYPVVAKLEFTSAK